MSDKGNVIHFTYMTIGELLKEGESVMAATRTIKTFSTGYILTKHHSLEKDIYVCPIMHILHADLETYPEYKELYDICCQTYGQSTLDHIIINEPNVVKSNCNIAINFAIDNIFHTDLIEIRIDKYKTGFITGNKYKETAAVVDTLYEFLQENFEIVSKVINDRTLICKIQKRRA